MLRILFGRGVNPNRGWKVNPVPTSLQRATITCERNCRPDLPCALPVLVTQSVDKACSLYSNRALWGYSGLISRFSTKLVGKNAVPDPKIRAKHLLEEFPERSEGPRINFRRRNINADQPRGPIADFERRRSKTAKAAKTASGRETCSAT